MKAVIMAGGRGTRIRSVASDIPKPMIPVLGKPVLQYQIENLKRDGFEDIILVTGYLSGAIRDHFGDGSRFGVRISYFNEDVPMGTAGALYYLKDRLQEPFILLMGDLMLSVDFGRFLEEHKRNGAAVTLFAHPNSHPYDSDLIVTDETGRLEMFTEDICGENADTSLTARPLSKPVLGIISKKQERGEDFYYHNLVNSGIYAISPEVLSDVPDPCGEAETAKTSDHAPEAAGNATQPGKNGVPAGEKAARKVDLDKDIIRPLISGGKVCAYRSTEYVKDMGTPERYEETAEAVRSGLVERKNLSGKQKCIFLDRDGTINVEKGFLNNAAGMELLPGAAESIKRINQSEYLAVLITNQPVIARGECSFEGLDEIQRKFETLLGREGAYIDSIYYCPHHPDSGFEGEVKELKFRCRCRKGKSGMINDAARDLNIDLSASWMIGDKTSDIKCGQGAGTRTVLLETGSAGSDGRFCITADLVCRDLPDAVSRILSDTGNENRKN